MVTCIYCLFKQFSRWDPILSYLSTDRFDPKPRAVATAVVNLPQSLEHFCFWQCIILVIWLTVPHENKICIFLMNLDKENCKRNDILNFLSSQLMVVATIQCCFCYKKSTEYCFDSWILLVL